MVESINEPDLVRQKFNVMDNPVEMDPDTGETINPLKLIGDALRAAEADGRLPKGFAKDCLCDPDLSASLGNDFHFVTKPIRREVAETLAQILATADDDFQSRYVHREILGASGPYMSTTTDAGLWANETVGLDGELPDRLASKLGADLRIASEATGASRG